METQEPTGVAAIVAKKPAFNDVREARHFGRQPLQRLVQYHETFVCIDTEGFCCGEGQVRRATAAFIGEPCSGVIDQRVAHGQGCRSQKVGLVRESAGLAQTQIRLMHERRGLQGVVAAETGTSPLGDVL